LLRFRGRVVSIKRCSESVISSWGVSMPTKPEQLMASPSDIRGCFFGGSDRVFDHGDLVLSFPTGVARYLVAISRPRRLD
jgi:hypothetical protein